MSIFKTLRWASALIICATVTFADAQVSKPAASQSQTTKTLKTAGVKGQLRSIKNSDRFTAAKLASLRRAAARAQGKSVTPVLQQEVKK